MVSCRIEWSFWIRRCHFSTWKLIDVNSLHYLLLMVIELIYYENKNNLQINKPIIGKYKTIQYPPNELFWAPYHSVQHLHESIAKIPAHFSPKNLHEITLAWAFKATHYTLASPFDSEWLNYCFLTILTQTLSNTHTQSKFYWLSVIHSIHIPQMA